jgi:hypothetical protein
MFHNSNFIATGPFTIRVGLFDPMGNDNDPHWNWISVRSTFRQKGRDLGVESYWINRANTFNRFHPMVSLYYLPRHYIDARTKGDANAL